MAEPTSIPVATAIPETEYKPLSGTAVASITFAGIFVLVLVILVVMGFLNKKPIDDRWHLLLAILGLVTAIVGRIQIQRSEGTRSGLALTNLAWWFCIIGGGGYFAYLQANEMTISAPTFGRSPFQWKGAVSRRPTCKACVRRSPLSAKRQVRPSSPPSGWHEAQAMPPPESR